MPVTIGASENSFANPIGLLSDCHRRIERFLQALMTVTTQCKGGSLDSVQRSAMETALKYFRQAAPKHTADEEEDLFPALRDLRGPRIAAVLGQIERLAREHETAATWHAEVGVLVERWLLQEWLIEADTVRLGDLLTLLTDLYRNHIALEENEVFSVAEQELSNSIKQTIGQRMASRRGITFEPEPAQLNRR